jgi:uncharacterized protein DUF3179
MRFACLILLIASSVGVAAADEPRIVARPDAFPTLVNPNCSHCVDEAKRRASELQEDDPVLAWTRGYSNGGAIPLRFFLAKHRVISDSYGVFVYDPDAGFARGFAPSYNFVFHGWHNGIMVIKDTKDGTLYSALSGIALEGPRKGERLKPVPTLTTKWGWWLKHYPGAVAYHMFEKYQPVELPKKANTESVKTRPAKIDPRLKPDELVLGVRVGDTTKAYPLGDWAKSQWYAEYVTDVVDGEKVIVMWQTETKSSAAYRSVAHQPRKYKAPQPDKGGVSPPDNGEPLPPGTPAAGPKPVDLEIRPLKGGPVLATKGGTNADTWDIAGRCQDGALKGWTLEPVDSVVCKWFAWSAEHPETEIYGQRTPEPKKKDDAIKEVAGAAEFLRLLPKPFATLKAVDVKARTVTLLMDGETVAKVWPVEPDAEIKIMGWWGRLEQLKVGDRVWVWLKLNRKKDPVAVAMLADEPSQQDIHGDVLEVKAIEGLRVTFGAKKKTERTLGWTTGEPPPKIGEKLFVQSAGTQVRWAGPADKFEEMRAAQRNELRKRWESEGLPGTISVQHVFSGELDVLMDHEGMKWTRSLNRGETIHIQAEPPIKAVVKTVTPWRERTQLRLVVGELAAADMKPGDRVAVTMVQPRNDLLASTYPPDIDRPRTTEERIEWFLASIYCTCKVRGDICTGHFYTLASCNPNGCGAPNETRRQVREMIDKGRSDREIWDELLAAKGPLVLKPHLLP